MKREGGGAEGGDFKRRTRPRRPVGRVAGAPTQKMTEREGASVRPRPRLREPKSWGTSADGDTELRTEGA